MTEKVEWRTETVGLKEQIDGKVMDKDKPIQDMDAIFQNLLGSSNFGKIDLPDNWYQIELDKEAKDMHHQKISATVQDVLTTSGIK